MAPENGHDDGEGNQNTVFIDTSLETHLATIVSDSDTVSDLKRKIVLEHRQCFPAIGDIKILCLKVKRRGIYYHLSDSMLVKSAFGASQKNWFLSVDVSQLQQCDNILQNKPGDQLALPWVKDSLSIEKHDNHIDKPSKLSLIHGSPSKHAKIVPFVNQKAPSVDQFTSDDSFKRISKNVEDRSSNDNHCRNLELDLDQQIDSKGEEKLDRVSKEIKLKKRTRDVSNEDVSNKKRRKTKKTESNVKDSEERNDDGDKVKDMGTSLNDEKIIAEKLKSKDADLNDVVTKDVNGEDTKTVFMSPKKTKRTRKGKNSSHDKVANVVPSNEEDVREKTCHEKRTEGSDVMLDVEMVVEKNIPEETPIQLSQKEKCSELVEEAGIGDEMPSSPMKGVTAEDELVVKHDDNPVADMSSSVPTPVSDVKIIDEQNKDNANIISDEKNEVSEKTLVDDSLVIQEKKDDDVIVKEVKITEPTESHRNGVHKEKSRKRVKKKSSKKDEVMKENDDVATGTNEDNFLPPFEIKENITTVDALHDDIGKKDDVLDNDAEIPKTEIKTSQLNEEIPEKQNEKTDDTKKPKRKKKTKKSTAKNESNDDLLEKIADVSQVDGDKVESKDAQISDEGLLKKSEKSHKLSKLADVAVSELSKGDDVNFDADIPKEGSHEIDFMEYFSPTQEKEKQDKITVHENVKETKLPVKEKKPKKKSKQQNDSRKDSNSIQSPSKTESKKELVSSKKIPEVIADEVVVKDQNAPNVNISKTQKPTKKIDALKANKPVQASSELGSSLEAFGRSVDEVVVKDQNAPNVNKSKTQKPTKKIDALKASKPVQASSELRSSLETFGSSLKSQKGNNNIKQPSIINQTQVKNMKNSVPGVKSLLNTPGSIFGSDSDDGSSANDNATVHSNSSTRTPLPSEESDSSIDSRRYEFKAVKRKQGDGNNNMNSQSTGKKLSMADLLRSSSRFKKARVTASKVNDTESEPVDFVPESQPV